MQFPCLCFIVPRKQADMEKERKNDIISPHDSASVLRCSRDEKPFHYTLQIQSFSLLKAALASSDRDRYESQSFSVDGYEWKLALYPNGDVKGNVFDHISLYLVLAEDDILSTTTASEVNVVFTFLVYDYLKDKFLTIQDGKVRRFHAIKIEWGFEKLVSLDFFNDASNGLLVNDCCAFGVDVNVMKCDGKGEVFSLIKQPTNYKYTWKVVNFSQLHLESYESDPFTVENYSWKIVLHPISGNKASRFLSLFLKLDSIKELPQGFQVNTEFEMAVLSGVQKKELTYKHWFGVEEIDWGHRQFISLSDLKEPTKGFLLDDTLIVEVKINVISTLRKFYRKGNAAA